MLANITTTAEGRLCAYRRELFGAKSEARDSDQLGLFNEAEVFGAGSSPAQEDTRYGRKQGLERENAGVTLLRKPPPPVPRKRRRRSTPKKHCVLPRTRALVRHAKAVDVIFAVQAGRGR